MRKKIKMALNLTQKKIQKGQRSSPAQGPQIICAKFGAIAKSASMRKNAKYDFFWLISIE